MNPQPLIDATEAPADDFHRHAPVPPAPGDRVPLRRKVAYGVGSLTDFFYANVLNAMYSPIYVIAMKLDPMLIGTAMAATRVIGAVTDPIIGTFSDNTRSRWGRRKPFILLGTLAGAVLLPLLWRVPGQSVWVQTAYIIALLSLFSVAYSCFAVPYGALGLEQTDDYDERTRLFAVRNYITTAAIFAGSWFYWFTLQKELRLFNQSFKLFSNEIVGVQVLSLLGAAVMIVCMLAVLRGTRERHAVAAVGAPVQKIPVLRALRLTFKNRAFLMIQAAALVVAFGTGIDGPIGMYLHIYYACAGNKEYASWIGGMGGTLSTASIYLAMPLAVWLSTRFSKREAAMTGMLIMLAGTLSLPFTLNPHHPWTVVITWVTNTIGSQISGLMYASMLGDICDDDELTTGTRREGAYVAANSFLGKAVQVLVLLIGGTLPHLAGYTDFSVPPTPDKLERMKWMLIGTSVAGIAASLWFIHRYPITRARAEATRRILEERQHANT